MLLSEDPATLITHTISRFNIEPDKAAVARIGESLSTLQQARELRIGDAESALKRLSRTLNTLRSRHEELVSTHSTASHASEIARLDTLKFRTAKVASDAETETERLAQQLADLNSRLQELDMQGVEGGPGGDDGAGGGKDPIDDEVLLRLKVYRSLGIDIEREGGEESGEFAKAVIRNDRKGDVHVVNLDKKFSRFFYANYFWQTV